MKQTFKQYIESREQLLNAIKNTPVAITEYQVTKYCSLTLGESEDEKVLVGLKPKHKVVVEWRYVTLDNPTIDSIRVITNESDAGDDKYTTFWPSAKLQKWLSRHTTTR